MIVVVDTNVSVNETHLLRKKGGPELVRLLRATTGRLLIPEILQNEYIDLAVRTASGERGKVDKSFSLLGTLLGLPFDHSVPDDDAVRLGTERRLEELESLTLSDPLTDKIKAAAGTRSLGSKRPTSKSDHGYKDCLIWESVLRQPPGSEVRFVSRDSAFFDGDGFHPDLVAEARERSITVVGYRDLQGVVEELTRTNPTLNLTAREARDLAEQAPGPAEQLPRSAPVPRPVQAVDHDQPLPPGMAEVARQLAEAQKRFDGLDHCCPDVELSNRDNYLILNREGMFFLGLDLNCDRSICDPARSLRAGNSDELWPIGIRAAHPAFAADHVSPLRRALRRTAQGQVVCITDSPR